MSLPYVLVFWRNADTEMGGLGYTPRLPLLFILGRDGRGIIDWKHKTEESSNDYPEILFP